jgi:hypothetical protein
MRSPKRGADTAIYLAGSPDVEGVTGRYFSDRKPKKSHKSSYDAAAAMRLWNVSADLVGLRVNEQAIERRPSHSPLWLPTATDLLMESPRGSTE